MTTPKKLLALLMLASAIVVTAHFLFSHFYPDDIDTGAIWNILNWFMAASILIALTYNFMRRRAANTGAGASDGMAANAAFYLTAVLALMFLWSWFAELASGDDDIGGTTRSITWVLVDSLYPVITAAAACHMWSSDDG